MATSYIRPIYPNELYHYGVKGQKWGVRRYQNSDGSLTAAGKKHYKGAKTKKEETDKNFEANKQKHEEMRSKVQKKTTDLEKEFDNSEKGKRLHSNVKNTENDLLKFYSGYSDNTNGEDFLWKKHDIAEAVYMKAKRKYIGDGLQKTFGSEQMKKFDIEDAAKIYDKNKEGARDITSDMNGRTYSEYYVDDWPYPILSEEFPRNF